MLSHHTTRSTYIFVAATFADIHDRPNCTYTNESSGYQSSNKNQKKEGKCIYTSLVCFNDNRTSMRNWLIHFLTFLFFCHVCRVFCLLWNAELERLWPNPLQSTFSVMALIAMRLVINTFCMQKQPSNTQSTQSMFCDV